jgi:radical SAM superfamily enzyme YgiQ (UPF0313 family)
MRVLLINPFCPFSEGPSPSLGLAFLAAALEHAGFETRVLDCVVEPYHPTLLEQLLETFRPGLVGITAVTMTFHHARQVLVDVKRIDSRLPTVMGGPHVSFCAEHTLAAVPELDFVVLGEGEQTLVALVQALERGSGWERLPGLVWRQEGRVHGNTRRPMALDLNRLPTPARHRLPLGRYRTLGVAVSMTTTRGCPHRCIFCVGRKMVGARVRYRDPQRVVDEMADLARMGFAQVNIADDLFTANAGHCLAICDGILQRGLKVRWTSFARVDTVSQPLLERMQAAGCSGVCFGVESGSRQILRTIRKGITPEQVVRAVELCNRAHLPAFASFIIGLPGETPATLAESVALGERLGSMGVAYGFHVLAPFPGTEVRERVERYDLRILSSDWRQYHANRAVVETSQMGRAQLDDFLETWDRRYLTWLGELRQRVQSGTASAEEAFPLHNLERVELLYRLMMDRGLERWGTWVDGAGCETAQAPLQRLAERLGRLPEYQGKPMADALALAQRNGGLRCDPQAAGWRWSWVSHLDGP